MRYWHCCHPETLRSRGSEVTAIYHHRRALFLSPRHADRNVRATRRLPCTNDSCAHPGHRYTYAIRANR